MTCAVVAKNSSREKKTYFKVTWNTLKIKWKIKTVLGQYFIFSKIYLSIENVSLFELQK